MTKPLQRVLVAGGAGFIGSHVCDRLVHEGVEVVCVDNLLTGSATNIEALVAMPNFRFVEWDITDAMEFEGALDAVLNLASPASPVDYLKFPLETLQVGSQGTRNCLELAKEKGSRFLLASTSEVYGDPLEHPQTESYWGRVNPIGPRSVYDEAKRFAEALTMAYRRTHGVDVAIARIFNTYGPKMRPDDGRVVSNFIVEALAQQPLTVYGDGSQTRSFCYVDDEVEGLLALLRSDEHGPMNLGNPVEFTVLELAKLVREVVGSESTIAFGPLPIDDPTQRRPDISLAQARLGWQPNTDLRTGIERTADWFGNRLAGTAARASSHYTAEVEEPRRDA